MTKPYLHLVLGQYQILLKASYVHSIESSFSYHNNVINIAGKSYSIINLHHLTSSRQPALVVLCYIKTADEYDKVALWQNKRSTNNSVAALLVDRAVGMVEVAEQQWQDLPVHNTIFEQYFDRLLYMEASQSYGLRLKLEA